MTEAPRLRQRLRPGGDPTRSAGRPRGRPPAPPTVVVSVRLPAEIYDRYCGCALRANLPVRSVLRQILTFYVPGRDFS